MFLPTGFRSNLVKGDAIIRQQHLDQHGLLGVLALGWGLGRGIGNG
jgi:hypothetical protein